ncbi:glycine cleavage system protein P [Mycobacterium rhizamassiliense]|uniref:Glycine cleavage system protein P n=2 Tax=Mycobacterium rhizamassiliense TaxID=1841860 RepID=A0A2U3NZ00_9MYCO|nr:glycine cleavage system protein P [Mycobacterium rhizamassiliense]
MRTVLALLGVSAMIGFAAPASAVPPPEPDGDDGGFLAALHQAGFNFANPGAAIGAGRAVCSCLNNGEAGLELVSDVKAHNPGMDMEMASNFALLSARFYCPHQLSKA